MDIDLISKRFFLSDRLIEADVAVVLGMNDYYRPVARAVSLYHSRKVKKLLFTGGFNALLGEIEAENMHRLACSMGVPEKDILVEPHANNTEENFQFAHNILASIQERGEITSLILVTIHYHLRRALIAAHKHFPTQIKIGWTCYPSLYYSVSNWFDSSKGRADIQSEIEKIDKYYGIDFTILTSEIL